MQLSFPSMDVDVINLFLISESPAKKKKLDTALESTVGTDSLPRISNRIKKKTSKAKATHFLNELDESEWLSDNETNFLEDNTLADAMAASDTKVYFLIFIVFNRIPKM